MRHVALLVSVLILVGCLNPNIGPVPNPAPVPVPTPIPEPVPSPGLISVLIVEETEDRAKPENRAFLGVLNSVAIREYMNTHCEKSADGRPQWRVLDKDADLTHAEQFWREAMARPRSSHPWIAITNGAAGTAGPLPATEAETLSLLKRWGGD